VNVPTCSSIVLINIGMWFERYVIIIRPVARPRRVGLYTPSWPELGSWRAASASSPVLLIFLKLFPVVAIAEVKEIEIHGKPRRRRTH
jgi:hypothetical protein